VAALAASGLSTACSVLRLPTPIPMDLIADDRGCAQQAPVLLVLLPGAHMTPAEMQAEGFLDAVRQRHLAVDVLAAGAALDYVYDGSVLRRLHEEVIGPYRARGYRRIWLAGISLGGFVAMGYAMQHPGQVEGIITLAPYLGRRQLVQEIADAGGPDRWGQARVSQVPRPDDMDQRLWRWLTDRPAGAPALYLGYGREDRFAASHKLLSQLLPATHVRSAPGGHDWPPWRQLWAEWLDAGLLPKACPA
jgi:pimeloyl-ACP methyl ester carboxylesterase